jgi:hypothetical protein
MPLLPKARETFGEPGDAVVLDSLQRATGQKFGLDEVDKWQKWWEENKDKYTEAKNPASSTPTNPTAPATSQK